MAVNTIGRWRAWLALAVTVMLLAPAPVRAHCDGLDGPVVKAAQKALETQNPAFALIWVQAKDEPEIRAAFEQTLAVRALSPRARELGPAIPAADRAIENGSIDAVLTLLTETMHRRLRVQFREVIEAKSFKADDVVAGREFVKAYVEFIHSVERLYEASSTAAHGHFEEPEADAHR